MKNMDEGKFREFLRKSKRSEKTVKVYISYVKKFEEYLLKYKRGKQLKEANPRDIKDFALWGRKELKSINPYLSGIQRYYEHTDNEDMRNAIEEISRGKPPKSNNLITWDDFRTCMDNAEKIGTNNRDRALLNLLWSEMDSNEILTLKISDIDFKNKCITSRLSRRTFYVTTKAWDALEKCVLKKERGKRKPLFSMGERNLQLITKKYLERLGQTPSKLRLSCRKDLITAGRITRFVTPALETVKGITLNENVLKWVDEQISTKGFRNRSDVIEHALEQLRKSNAIY